MIGVRTVLPRRRGYSIALLALLLFGMMALAALVIDLGLARLTQRQMQTAVDAAAIEGLRYRDRLPSGSSTTDLEQTRRDAASLIVAQLFDDDLDPTNGDDGIVGTGGAFGAGPIVEFSGGAGDPSMNASQLLSLPTTPVFKPQSNGGEAGLRPNLPDDSRGDMVNGNFDRSTQNASYSPPGGDRDLSLHEYVEPSGGGYVRRNFTTAVDDPSTPENEALGNAFLVRMRRTGEILPADVGVANTTLPYLFGRGSLVARDQLGAGIKVRATAIAHAQPVVVVGVAQPGLSMLGRIDLAISSADWTSGNPTPAYFATSTGAIGEVVGASVSSPTRSEGYIGIFSAVANNRVIGFGHVSIVAGTLSRLTPAGRAGLIVHENVSAVPNRSMPLAGSDLGLVFSERTRLFGANQLLLAPVSAR